MLTRGGIDGNHLKPVPKGTENHPHIAAEVHVTGRINRVVIVSGGGLKNQALVRPLVIGGSGIEGGIGGQADHGVVGSKRRAGVINPVSSVSVPGVGSPDVSDAGAQGRGHPGWHRRDNIPHYLPVDLVGGLPNLKKIVCRQQGVNTAGIAYDRGIMGTDQNFSLQRGANSYHHH